VSVRIYVEGGFEGSTKTDCRKAFRLFFEKVIQHGSFRVIASGDRATAFKDFRTALQQHPGDFVMLLVDSEEEVQAEPWEHLRLRTGDGWLRPTGATDEQAHMMVQVMESWFLADQPTLAGYYGQGFLANSLPKQPDIETIPKAKVYASLQHATKPTQKGEYHKTRHGFDLLELINPGLVRAASIHAERLFVVLERET
jgi:Domain of unknown function (DUF4276)